MPRYRSFELRLLAASLIIIVVGVLWIIPMYSLLAGSLKSLAEVQGTPVLSPPARPSLEAVRKVSLELRDPIINTVLIVVPVALVSTLLGSAAAYAIYRRMDRVSDTIMVLIAIATYIPYHAILVPLINLIKGLGLYDTLPGIALALLVYYTPMAALLMVIFISAIPRFYIEAAMVDGAGDSRIYRRVVLPLLGPGITSTMIFILIMTWNNFFIPLMLSRGYEKYITLKIFSYVGQSGTLYNEMFAASLIGSLPPLIIFLAMGRYFIKGLQAFGGGVKG
ncbi:MAG: carbohydrate ABC transporter permease [Desulfurococcales archaeon]|nr:carbohydrate ABC transporter permease [Desulfurococcales archaeon]